MEYKNSLVKPPMDGKKTSHTCNGIHIYLIIYKSTLTICEMFKSALTLVALLQNKCMNGVQTHTTTTCSQLYGSL